MLQKPEECVRRLAEFVGRPFSDEEERKGIVGDIVKLCSFNSLKELEVNREGMVKFGESGVHNSAFFRNGKSGSWKDELCPEIAERVDKITRQKFEDLDI